MSIGPLVRICGVMVTVVIGMAAAIQPAVAQPRVGVFYFPGWKDDALGLEYKKPWEPIKAFPEREPLLGWYAEGQPAVMQQQLTWMQQHGISHVVFDWYWGGEVEVLGHAVKAYFQAPARSQVPYSLMWANHSRAPRSERDFELMINELADKHFSRPEYLKQGGRPLFFVQVPERLQANAALFGMDTAQLLNKAQAMLAAKGLPPMLVVAGAGGGPGIVTANARRWGYAAYFTYNYHAGVGSRTKGEVRFSRSYQELDEGYREHWDWFMKQGDLPYVVPMTAGWDKRPWGGSRDPLHDRSVPSRPEFEAHLRRAREVMVQNPEKTWSLGVVCCWNEFGEGSIVEPTKALRFERLEAIRTVFELLPPKK